MSDGNGVSRRRAIRHYERTGVILPGHGDTIAAYRATDEENPDP